MQTAEIRTEMARLQEQNQAIMGIPETHNRDLTADEAAEFDQNSQLFDSLNAQLIRSDRLEQQTIWAREPQPRLTRSPQPGAYNHDGYPVQARTFAAQVVNHQAFRAWHQNQGWRRRQSLNFEIQAANLFPSESQMPILAPGVGGAPSWPDTGVFRSLIPKTPMGGPSITALKEVSETSNAGYQTDYGAVKPESFINLAAVNVPTVTIAHYYRVPDQLVEDITGFEAFIQSRLLLDLIRFEEQQLAAGTGGTTGFGTLQGLVPVATEVTPGAGTPTEIDNVLTGIATIAANGFKANAVVCSPASWARMVGTKTIQGSYVITTTPSPAAPMSLFGVPVYVSSALAIEWLAGDFVNRSRLFTAKTATIDISMHDLDNFTKNMVTIRAELREAHVVYNAKAYVKQTAGSTMATQQERKAK